MQVDLNPQYRPLAVDIQSVIEKVCASQGHLGAEELSAAAAWDVPEMFADIEDLVGDVGCRPATSVEVGVERFVEWLIGPKRFSSKRTRPSALLHRVHKKLGTPISHRWTKMTFTSVIAAN